MRAKIEGRQKFFDCVRSWSTTSIEIVGHHLRTHPGLTRQLRSRPLAGRHLTFDDLAEFVVDDHIHTPDCNTLAQRLKVTSNSMVLTKNFDSGQTLVEE